ncbi:neuronal acetylcholine receptor subunit alpha-7-like [Diadema setosum]|uniref:neuronal acetylcholine receptor subunit alpha-7-like n=1 Tax=Diadema setosum TaxID=31175 RepID=UPI003B3AAE24
MGEASGDLRFLKRRLYTDLIGNYGPNTIRPVFNDSTPIQVKLRMVVYHLVEFDEPLQQITLHAAVKLVWHDAFLVWNETDYGGISNFETDVDMIWTPDITLLTSNKLDSYKMILRRATVSSSGEVSWLSPVILTSSCLFDVYLFPFDVQRCTFEFSSWTSSRELLDLDFFSERNRTTLNSFRYNGAWGIQEDITEKILRLYSCCDEPFTEVHYHLTLWRVSTSYVLGIIIPSVLLSLTTLLIFMLPPESGEKISFGVTNLLAMVLFHETVRAAMPPSGSPALANYICIMIILSCLSVLVEAIVLRMYNKSDDVSPAVWFQRLVSGPCAKIKHRGVKQEKFPSALCYGDMVKVSSLAQEKDDRSEGMNADRLWGDDAQKVGVKDGGKTRPSGPDGEKTWREVAMYFEKRASIVLICCVVGNIVFWTFRIAILKAIEDD